MTGKTRDKILVFLMALTVFGLGCVGGIIGYIILSPPCVGG